MQILHLLMRIRILPKKRSNRILSRYLKYVSNSVYFIKKISLPNFFFKLNLYENIFAIWNDLGVSRSLRLLYLPLNRFCFPPWRRPYPPPPSLLSAHPELKKYKNRTITSVESCDKVRYVQEVVARPKILNPTILSNWIRVT